MNLDDMSAAADGDGVVYFVLPPPTGRGYTMRLFGTHGPRGNIIRRNVITGTSLVAFDRAAVRRACAKLLAARRRFDDFQRNPQPCHELQEKKS